MGKADGDGIMLRCHQCPYIANQRWNVDRLWNLLNHYQKCHTTGNRQYAFDKMQEDLLRRKRAASRV